MLKASERNKAAGRSRIYSSGKRDNEAMKRFLLKAFWLLVALAGLYLLFIEVGMAISEFHALRGTNIIFFAVFAVLGLFLFILGLSKLLRKPVAKR